MHVACCWDVRQPRKNGEPGDAIPPQSILSSLSNLGGLVARRSPRQQMTQGSPSPHSPSSTTPLPLSPVESYQWLKNWFSSGYSPRCLWLWGRPPPLPPTTPSLPLSPVKSYQWLKNWYSSGYPQRRLWLWGRAAPLLPPSTTPYPPTTTCLFRPSSHTSDLKTGTLVAILQDTCGVTGPMVSPVSEYNDWVS